MGSIPDSGFNFNFILLTIIISLIKEFCAKSCIFGISVQCRTERYKNFFKNLVMANPQFRFSRFLTKFNTQWGEGGGILKRFSYYEIYMPSGSKDAFKKVGFTILLRR